MKPAPFRYSRARSGPATGALLAGLGGGAILAGGQSLVPVMNFRLARPRRAGGQRRAAAADPGPGTGTRH